MMRLTVGLMPTGAGKSLITYLLPRVLDIIYDRREAPMRCYISVPLMACVVGCVVECTVFFLFFSLSWEFVPMCLSDT
jgi:hypothetical protein